MMDISLASSPRRRGPMNTDPSRRPPVFVDPRLRGDDDVGLGNA
jgi:hypothetical protein